MIPVPCPARGSGQQSGAAGRGLRPVQATLSDGQSVVIRAVRPDDRALLVRGFTQLGPDSRRSRFLGAKKELSDADLNYLTHVDGTKHFAIGAVALDVDGQEVPLGIARFVRSSVDSEVAEPAVTVVDSSQRKGLGKLLLRHLSDAAYELGVRRFRCQVLASNAGVHHLLEDMQARVHVLRRECGTEVLEVDVPKPDVHGESAPERAVLDSLLRLAASKRT